MAFTKKYSVSRSDIATLTGTPGSRGEVLNGEQVEKVVGTKLTGDTTFNITLVSITRPTKVYVEPTLDSVGTIVDTYTAVPVTFVQVSARVITVSGLGTFTRGRFCVTGRADA